MVFDPAKARRAELRGDRTSASRVDKSCLPNRSYPPEDPCFKLRGSGKDRRCAPQNRTRRSLQGFAPSAGNTWDRTSPARAICESSLLQSEQRLRADLGACCPLFRAATTMRNASFTQPLSRLGSKCIPVGSAESTITGPVEPRRTAVPFGNEPPISHRPAQTASSARINTRSRSLIPGV
jgi:hypothetical protein